jgi:hypothetical protein
MKYIYILAAAIGVAAAQSVSQLFTALPPCAVSCRKTYLADRALN